MKRYNSLFLTFLAGGLLLLSACKSTENTQEALTMEEQLVQQHIAATGGQESWDALQSITTTGNLEIQGMSLGMTIKQKRPNMSRSDVDAMGMMFVNGYDGETAWTINPMMSTKPQKLPAEVAAISKESADMDGVLIGYADQGYTLEYLGEEAVRDKNTHKLKVMRPEMSDVTVYLDAETYLIVRQDGEGVDGQTGNIIPTTTYMSDYREVGGVLMPFSMEVVQGGQTLRLNLQDATANPEIDDTIFAFPEE